jgi:hypothetical protein
MMAELKRSGLVWALLLCLVLVNGFMAAPSVAHAAHHATHKAGTHTTGLCAWLCAAGQGIETSSVSLESTLQLVDRVDFYHVDRPQHDRASCIFLRGPPAFSR